MIRTRCEVLSNRATGVYRSLTLVAPDIAEVARPGQFVQIGVPEDRTFMLRGLTLALCHDTSPETKITTQEVELLRESDPQAADLKERERTGGRPDRGSTSCPAALSLKCTT